MLPLYLFWMIPVFLILVVVVIVSRPERRRLAFEKEVARVQAEINARGFELSQRESALHAKLGKTDSEGYRKMLQERDDLLVQMLGDFAKDFTRRLVPRGDT
jgi:hypothetical protein